MLHPESKQKVSYVQQCLSAKSGPVVASTDYIKLYAEQIRAYVPDAYRVLGTDGFGRSDGRAKLREFFEVNRDYVVIAALSELAKAKQIKPDVVSAAIKKLGLDTEKINPLLV